MPSNLPFDRSLLASLIAVGLAGCAATAGTLPAGAPAPATATGTVAAAPAPTAQPTPPGTPKAAPAAAASGPAGAASAPAAPRPPGSPPPFADVTKDAASKEGLLTVWTKDDKTWLEIPKDWIGKPMFLGNSLASGLGEGFVLPGLMGREQVVVLRRAGNNVQLVARSLHARAPAGTPLASALADSYSDSLLAAAPLASAPHPTRQSLLVDAAALLGGDLMGLQTLLEASFRMPYALDRGNSTIERARTSAQGTTLTFRSHFMVPKMPPPPVMAPGVPPPNPALLPRPPKSLPDARSLFIHVAYSLTPLPEQAMKPRVADPRVGYFTDVFVDLADDTTEHSYAHFINRWRLEKKDPAAAVSEPKQPIRVVMDRNIPEKWRAPVREGILEWNKAYERAGWRNAVVVEQQADNADDTVFEAPRVLAVRWFAAEGPGALAVGPSQSDPRTGEILRGAAIIPENWVRFFRNQATDVEPRLSAAPTLDFAQRYLACTYASDKLEQVAFGHELLSARGAFDPKGPEAERYIAGSLKDVTMHEVGHALGLRHNFRASIGVAPQQLRDPAFTATRGVSNSVMDYNALNMPLRGETVADYHMPTLGTYDYWAIEYGYREFDAADEKAALARLATQSEKDPALAYGTDEDAFGTDPQINHRDLGSDPLAFARREIKLARELWTLTQARELPADSDYTVYRRNLQRGLNNMQSVVGMVAKHVGGAYTSRQLAGAGQPAIAPVPGARQREALDLLVSEVFASSSFRFDPKFMSRLGVNHLDRFGMGRFQVATDFSLAAAVGTIQRSALDTLMSDSLAARLADAEVKVADTRTLLGYAEVQQRLADAAWSELKGSNREIDSLRRNLQREHLRRLAGALVRASSAAAADVRSVHRMVAQKLEAELKRAAAAPGWNDTARAHLAESAQTLAEALRAPLMKQGV